MSIASTIIRTLSCAISPVSVKDFTVSLPAVQPHSVRARLHELATQGLISRIAKGMYVHSAKDVQQIGAQADSVAAVKEMARAGFKADAVFLDVPYGVAEEGAGVSGGNRTINDFPCMHSRDFAGMAKDIAAIVGQDAPVILVMSNGKSSAKAKAGWMGVMLGAGFKLAAEGDYTKTYANGNPCSFMGRPMPSEGIFIFTKSGKVDADHNALRLSAVRPNPKTTYPTAKAISMLSSLFSALTKAGDVILDPFAGSGSTAVACQQIGRSSICFDILHNPVLFAKM
jgi:DNA methylase